jgi:hypothetical protein
MGALASRHLWGVGYQPENPRFGWFFLAFALKFRIGEAGAPENVLV